MATTRESIDDGLRWVGRVLRIAVRRAIVLGILAGLFALAVFLTTRERVSDCSEVSERQRADVHELRTADADRSFTVTEAARCTDGLFTAPVAGLPTTMEAASAQLERDGWERDTDFVPYFDQLWRRCFRFDGDRYVGVQLLVDASRRGVVREVRAVAPERADACELEQRDVSRIFPPPDRDRR